MIQYTGNIDFVEIGTGFVIIDGWLASTEYRSTPSDLHISIDRSRFFPVEKLLIRQDLIDAGVCNGPAGFRLELPFRGALSEQPIVTVFSPANKTGLRFGNMPLRVFSPRGSLDRADSGGVEGWVYDPAMWHADTRPQIVIDDRIAIDIEPTIVRQDVISALAISSRPLGFVIRSDEIVNAVRAANVAIPKRSYKHRIKLISGTAIIAEDTLSLHRRLRGNIEHFRDGMVYGWAVDLDAPDSPMQVTLQVEGVPYSTVSASGRRADLAERGLSREFGGFAAPLPMNPTGEEDLDITATLAGTAEAFANRRLRIAGLARPTFEPDWHRVLHDISNEARPITIIVPIYNAPDELTACLASLKRHTTLPCQLMLIDDASSDRRIRSILSETASWPNTTVIRNQENLGFVRSCNLGLAQAPDSDVVLLNSDTIVGPRWLENLRLAVHSRPLVATATPLSDNAGVFSVPEIGIPNVSPPGWSTADMTRFVSQESTGLMPTVPTGHGFCLYIRRDCLNKIGLLDAQAFPRGYGEENDFCMRALRAGYSHVMDDRSFVHHKRSASFGKERRTLYGSAQTLLRRRYPEYKILTRQFSTSGPILTMRWRLRSALAAAKNPPRPRILFVIATETGGTPQTNRDLMEALIDRYDPWLLQSDSHKVSLFQLVDPAQAARLVESHILDTPVEMATHHSEAYDRVVARLLVSHAFELVHVRHVGWHSLGLFKICRQLSLPVVFSFHDFYTICPSIKLIDSCGSPCCLGPKQSEVPCEAELWQAYNVPPLKPDFVGRWRVMMGRALSQADAYVTTSLEAKRRLCQAYPFLDEKDFRVISHGRDFPVMQSLAQPISQGECLRILVPGNISRAKGASLIRDIANIDKGHTVEFHILGDPGFLESGPGIVLHGRYERCEFGSHVEMIKPHIGAIFSRWPETYCHTLTEMWSCGIAVFGTDIGAVGERIARHGAGWLHALADTPEDVLSQLSALAAVPADISARTAQVEVWQRGHGRDYGCSLMAARYDVLYRQVKARRSSLNRNFDEIYIWAQLSRKGSKNQSFSINARRHVVVQFHNLPLINEPEFANVEGVIVSGLYASYFNSIGVGCFRLDSSIKIIIDLRFISIKEIKKINVQLLEKAEVVIVKKTESFYVIRELSENINVFKLKVGSDIDEIIDIAHSLKSNPIDVSLRVSTTDI
jgi:GT2 family glycosyltransferase/glycosyltransferase involved in cell wall biosynthesis